jgi:histidinol-phosphate aminotransferase
VNLLNPKPSTRHLSVYQPGKPLEEVKRELGLTDVIKLASNENPFGCSPKVIAALQAEFENISLYPDGGSVELAQVVAKQFDVQPNQLIFGAGSDEVILMIARAFLLPGDETIMATHTFPQYKHNTDIEGAVSVQVPLKEGTHDLEAMAAQITSRTKVMWVCNPNNPTGTMNTHQEVSTFLAKVPAHVLVVLDEAYCEYNMTGQYPRTFDILKQYKNVVALRTFSKIYGLAALRIGFGVGHPDVIQMINQVREPFNTTRFAQVAARVAIEDVAFIEQCRQQNATGVAYMQQQFKRLQLQSFPAHGNFIMVDVKRPAEQVFDALLRKGIIIRGGHKLGFPTSIRVTVGSSAQNQKFIEALEHVLSEVAIHQ